MQDWSKGLPSYKFGLAILLLLDDAYTIDLAQMNYAESLNQYIDIIERTMHAAPDAFDDDQNNRKALCQMRRHLGVDLASVCDVTSAGLILAKLAAQAYDTSLMLLNYPPICGLSHQFVLERLKGSLQDDRPGVREYEAFLEAHQRLIFYDGYPQSEVAVHRSLYTICYC